MGRYCCIRSCNSRYGDDIRLHRIPKAAAKWKSSNPVKLLTLKRRMAWLKAIRIKDIHEVNLDYMNVCSLHFISKEPANIFDYKNPDWVPNVNLDVETTKMYWVPKNVGIKDCKKNQSRVRTFVITPKLEDMIDIDSSMADLKNLEDPLDKGNNKVKVKYISSSYKAGCQTKEIIEKDSGHLDKSLIEIRYQTQKNNIENTKVACLATPVHEFSSQTPDFHKVDLQYVQTTTLNEVACQTEEFYFEEYCNETLRKKYDQLLKKNEELNKELHEIKTHKDLSYEAMRNDDKKTRYYTGFNSFDILETFFKSISKDILKIKWKRLHYGLITSEDRFFITLLKIRLNLPSTFLSYQYSVAFNTIYKLLNKTIDVIKTHLEPHITWPEIEETNKESMPKILSNIFGEKIIIYVQCFEVFYEKPNNFFGRSIFFSNNGGNYLSLKYLIAISAIGHIGFISEGFAPNYSNKYIFENCGIFEKINDEDVILCDSRLMNEWVDHSKPKTINIVFRNDKSELECLEVEETPGNAKMRTHYEKVIGILRLRHIILSNKQPICYIPKRNDREQYCNDIMKIGCGIFNLDDHVISILIDKNDNTEIQESVES